MKKPTDLSHAFSYRIYSQPSEENDALFFEISRNGELYVVKENDDVKKVKFKFKDLKDFSSLLQRLLEATNQFIQSSEQKVNKE